MRHYLVDTHAHIDMKNYDNVDETVKKASDFGVKKIIVPSVDENSFEKVIELSNSYENVYCALGIHPTETKNLSDEVYERILNLASGQNVVAIGECGLDYFHDKSFVEEQKKAFIKQIEIANLIKKPLLIHDREAHKDCFDILSQNVEESIPVIMHCFSGSLEFAQQCIKKGYYIAIGGVVTFKNAKKVHEIAQKIPLKNLLLETDAPFLTPEPHRGERNEPAYVKFIAERIAQLRNIPVEKIADITSNNVRKVFGI